MIDIETIDTLDSAVILSIGAVKFNPWDTTEPHSPMYVRLNVDSQIESGRTVSDSTIEWWSKQPAHVRDEAFSDGERTDPVQFLHDLRRYAVGVKRIYAQGPLFDIKVLENLFAQHKLPAPWQYAQIRDSRTIQDFGDDSVKTGNVDLHNALADAYAQAVMVQQIIKSLGIKEK
jgi:exodeoxyribonuclease VIII